jgi:hypothetical protein
MSAYVRVGGLAHYSLTSDKLSFRVDALADALPPGEWPHLSFTLNEGTDLDLTDTWCGLLRAACRAYLEQVMWSTNRERIATTAEMLADENSPLGLELDEAWANDRLQAADEMTARAGVIRTQAQGCLAGIADQRAAEARERARRDADDDTRALLAEKLRDEAREAELATMEAEL